MGTGPLSSLAFEHLASLVVAASPRALIAVADALDEGRLSLDSTAVGIGRLRGIDDRNAELFARAFAAVRTSLDAASLTLALRTAHAVTVRDADRSVRVEVVWTGPDAGGPPVRPTAAVITEMLRNTRSGGEILLVGYSLTADDGSSSKDVIELLGAASREQAQVRVVLHRDDEERNRANLLAAWDVFAVKPKIYTWDPEAGGPYSKMHAKVLIVDRLDVLVTSANLTFHGLHKNIEVGLRVRGPQAAAIAQRFDHLIAEQVLKLWA